MYKLAAIDLDGTMLNQYGVVTQKTKEAIQKAQEAGIEVIIAAVAMVVDYFVNAHHALANARNAGQRLKYRAGRIARGNGLVAQRGSVRRSFADKVFALFLCKALHEPVRII